MMGRCTGGIWVALLGLLAAGRAVGQTLYTNDGVLNARQETQRWWINRARFDPEKEADRLGLVNSTAGGHPDYDCCEDTSANNDFGTTPAEWVPWKASKPPLAPHRLLRLTATNHARDMAETGIFQHNSPSANYYPLNSTPGQRLTAQGYTWSAYGECIGGNYASGRAFHEGIFRDSIIEDRGHRRIILGADYRELGVGNAYRPASGWTYDVQDYGARSSGHFFTDTIFFDANANGIYDEGEGVSNIVVTLFDGATRYGTGDLSTASGNFAVPIDALTDGRSITVKLSNTNGSPNARVTLPFGYNTAGDIWLPRGATNTIGVFTQPVGRVNVGFRNIEPHILATREARSNNNVHVSFSAFARVTYVIESADAGLKGTWRPFFTNTAATSTVAFVDSGQCGRGLPTTKTNRFYRARMVRD